MNKFITDLGDGRYEKIKNLIYNYISNKNLIQLSKVTNQRKHYSEIKEEACHREVADDEIVIEFDTDNNMLVKTLINKVIIRLHYLDYKYAVFDHYGRSPHIHIYSITGLSDLEPILRTEYKRTFCNYITKSKYLDAGVNTTREHLIAYEFRKHWKTGQEKILVGSNITDSLDNYLDLDILDEARISEQKILKKMFDKNIKMEYDNRWFIRWLLSEPMPDGNRDMLIWKNLAILLVEYNILPEPIVCILADLNGMNVYRQVVGWLQWCKKQPRQFSVGEVMRYCDEHNIEFQTVRKKWLKV